MKHSRVLPQSPCRTAPSCAAPAAWSPRLPDFLHGAQQHDGRGIVHDAFPKDEGVDEGRGVGVQNLCTQASEVGGGVHRKFVGRARGLTASEMAQEALARLCCHTCTC